jgi:hypothetical protein
VSYVFPLPPDSSIHDFTAHIDDHIVKGVVKEKKAARAEYDRAVAMNRQAVLLQQENVEGKFQGGFALISSHKFFQFSS